MIARFPGRIPHVGNPLPVWRNCRCLFIVVIADNQIELTFESRVHMSNPVSGCRNRTAASSPSEAHSMATGPSSESSSRGIFHGTAIIPRLAQSTSITLCGVTFHLAVLSSFALAQPLFNLIAASPEFLVAHRLGSGFLIVLMGLVVLGPPALVLLVVGLGGSLHAQIRNVAVGVGVAGFTCCFWLPVLKRWPEEPGWLVLLLAAVIGIGVGNCYLRFQTIRLFISFLSPGLLLFPVLFLAQPPITKLLFRAVPADTVATGIDSQTPVVLAVFDQLPLASLLDSQKQIDAKLFPHFAELARGSIWFRNATTVSDITRQALPAILTGNYPRPALLPTTADNPKNLFTFLGPAYNLKVVEPITALCPEDLCQRTEKSSGARLWTLLVDLSITYFHILAPADYAHLMPPIDQKWMDFASETVQDANQAWIVERSRDRRQGPLRFIEAIRADDPQPTLYFLHSLLPHEPYLLLPSGKFYGPTQNLTGLLHGERWTTEALAVDLSYQRHLMQVRYADQLLGKLMERLRTVNIYEKSMLVVTADHGASFRPGDLFKKPTRTNLPDPLCQHE